MAGLSPAELAANVLINLHEGVPLSSPDANSVPSWLMAVVRISYE